MLQKKKILKLKEFAEPNQQIIDIWLIFGQDAIQSSFLLSIQEGTITYIFSHLDTVQKLHFLLK